MTTLKQDSFPWRAMHLAIRPQGTTYLDFPRMAKKDHLKSMGRLLCRGIVSRKRIDGMLTYFATPEQLHTYKNQKPGRPPIPSEQKAAKALKHNQNITFVQPNPRPSKSDLEHFKAKDATYPVDEQGRPLYKITIAPPPPQPLKTNTHTGAY